MKIRLTDLESINRIWGFWLRDRDSNPDRLIQSQVSYHWTIPQRREDISTGVLSAQIRAFWLRWFRSGRPIAMRALHPE